MSPATRPEAFGQLIRDRRGQLGLSVRAVARIAGVSPAYVNALELGRRSTAGRPSSPSVRVIAGLATALQLAPAALLRELGAPRAASHGEHVLLYCLGPQSMPSLELVEQLYGDQVDRWLYIADPRDTVSASRADERRARVCHWPLGAFPYPDRTLVAENIVEALAEEVASMDPARGSERFGVAIADCSAVMRWAQNAEAEVELEGSWDAHVERIWTERFGSPPAVNICAYWHDDLDTVGHAIDQVGTALSLIRTHDAIVVIDEQGAGTTGSPAIRRMLEQVRPSGVTSSSWTELADAAASTLALHP